MMIFKHKDDKFEIPSVKAEFDSDNQFENELEEKYDLHLDVEFYDGKKYCAALRKIDPKKRLPRSKKPLFISVSYRLTKDPTKSMKADCLIDLNEVPIRKAVYKLAEGLEPYLPKFI